MAHQLTWRAQAPVMGNQPGSMLSPFHVGKTLPIAHDLAFENALLEAAQDLGRVQLLACHLGKQELLVRQQVRLLRTENLQLVIRIVLATNKERERATDGRVLPLDPRHDTFRQFLADMLDHQFRATLMVECHAYQLADFRLPAPLLLLWKYQWLDLVTVQVQVDG